MASELKVDTLKDSTGNFSVNVNTIKIQAYASVYYSVNDAAGTLTIADTSTYGVKMQFNKAGPCKNISVNTANSTWTHSYTGIYRIYTAYRQASGGDVWTVLAVTKNGNAEAVGVSARTGSEDSHNENYTIVYTVDSTTATYQLQHWVQSTGKTVTSDFLGNPGWTNYSTLVGGTTGDIGRMVDYYIERLGDLP